MIRPLLAWFRGEPRQKQVTAEGEQKVEGEKKEMSDVAVNKGGEEQGVR